MIIPRFEVSVLDANRTDTRNTQLAAAIYAFDVPFADPPLTTEAGDGIQGVRVTWHFKSQGVTGHTPGGIINCWLDEVWHAKNPTHPLAQLKQAFAIHREMTQLAKGLPCSRDLWKFQGVDSVSCFDNRQAACAWAIGHKFEGYTVKDGIYRWHFDRGAAADLALYERDDLCRTLPDANIAYVKAGLINHLHFVHLIKHFVTTHRVEHKGRIARIGKDIPQLMLDKLERILYRK